VAGDWLPAPGGLVRIPLFDNEFVDIVIDKIESQHGGLFSVGHVDLHPELTAYFGSFGGCVSAAWSSTSGKQMVLRPLYPGAHVLAEERTGEIFTNDAAEHEIGFGPQSNLERGSMSSVGTASGVA
jgi:hypothetical protein